MARFTYVNGKKSGDSYEIFNERWGRVKSSGAYVNDLRQGWWTRIYVNGNVLIDKVLYEQGVITSDVEYSQGKRSATYTYTKGRQTGAARVFGNSEAEFASGEYVDGKPSGTWSNAAYESDKIIYRKNASLVFFNGNLIESRDASGSVRSVMAEATQKLDEENKARASKQEEEARERLAAIDPYNLSNATFYSDSYTLTDRTKSVLDYYAKKINYRNSVATSFGKVEVIHISTHCASTKRGTDEDEKREKMMFILSLNRAFAIKHYFESKITDKSVQYQIMGCGSKRLPDFGDIQSLGDDARIQITVKDELPKASAAYDELSAKYGIKAQNTIIPNPLLRANILDWINAWYQSEVATNALVGAQRFLNNTANYPSGDYTKSYDYADHIKVYGKIPVEYWLPTEYSESYGEEAPDDFKKLVTITIAKLNKQHEMSEGYALSPLVFYNKSLLDYIARNEPR